MGLYEYVVMLLGLVYVPTTFQHIMNKNCRICCTIVLRCTWMTFWCFLIPSSSTWLTSRKCLNGSAHCNLKQSAKMVNLASIVSNIWGMLWKMALCTLTLIKYQLCALGLNLPMWRNCSNWWLLQITMLNAYVTLRTLLHLWCISCCPSTYGCGDQSKSMLLKICANCCVTHLCWSCPTCKSAS